MKILNAIQLLKRNVLEVYIIALTVFILRWRVNEMFSTEIITEKTTSSIDHFNTEQTRAILSTLEEAQQVVAISCYYESENIVH